MFLYGGQGRKAVYMQSRAIVDSCRPCSFTAKGEKMQQLAKFGLKCRLYAVLALSPYQIKGERKTQSGRILAPFLDAPCVKRGREGEEAAHNVNRIMVNHNDAS